MIDVDPAQADLSPAVGSRPVVFVVEEIPGCAVGAVVLAHRAPLPLGEVGPPALPVSAPLPGLLEPQLLLGHSSHRSALLGRADLEIGRASCRERGYSWVRAVSCKKGDNGSRRVLGG